MAVKANVLLKTIGEKIGLSADQIAKLSGNPALLTIDIDDDVAIEVTNKEVFTADSAASNGKIRSKLKAEFFDGVDQQARTLAIKHGLSEDEVKELDKLLKTEEKLDKVMEKIVAKEKLASQSSGKVKSDLEKEIEKLNGQVKSVKDEYELKINSLESQRKDDRVNWEIGSKFNGLDYAIPDGFSKSDFALASRAIMENKLKEKGVKFKLTDTGLEPYNAKDDTRYYDNNVAISADDLIKKLATESKLVKVSNGKEGTQTTQFKVQQNQNQQPAIRINGALDNKLTESIERHNNG